MNHFIEDLFLLNLSITRGNVFRKHRLEAYATILTPVNIGQAKCRARIVIPLNMYRKIKGADKMKVEPILKVGKINREEKAIDLTCHINGRERVSLLEELRREMSKVTHHEYPRRLRRILEVSKR